MTEENELDDDEKDNFDDSPNYKSSTRDTDNKTEKQVIVAN